MSGPFDSKWDLLHDACLTSAASGLDGVVMHADVKAE